MATFVLVHGAMHGGWAWTPVARRLRAAGHDAFAPTLSGQGERRGALTPEVGVETHVLDVLELLRFEGLRDVVLVLHSYAGVLAGPIAERAEGALGAVVLAGAFVAAPGESLADVEPPELAARYAELAARGDGWRVPASDAFLDQWGVTDPGLRAFVGPRLTDFPYRAVVEPVAFDPSALRALPRFVIEHTAPPLASLRRSTDRAVADGATRLEIAAGHDFMLAAPEATAELVLSVAAARR